MGALWEGLAALPLEPGPGPGPPVPESGFPRGGWPRYASLGLGPGAEETLRIPETNLEPKLLSMPRTMLHFELPTAISMGRGSLLVSLFACLFACLAEAWALKHGRSHENFIIRNELSFVV